MSSCGTRRTSATSPASTSCTCSATSAPTRSRSPASARASTGLDFSPGALAVGRDLAARMGLDVAFVEAELYAAPEVLGSERFDLVYTGIGALCWLPDIRRWAETVAALLRPGGRLYLREGHPVLWATDEIGARPARTQVSVLRAARADAVRRGVHLHRRRSRSPSPSATSGTTASARSCRPCSTPG